MKHLVFYSGGAASWYVAESLKKEVGLDDLYLQFTDTLTEHNSLYLFLIQSISDIYGLGREEVSELEDYVRKMPEIYEDRDTRKEMLEKLRVDFTRLVPNFDWISSNMDIWDLFQKSKYIGNGRIAVCSSELKQKASRKVTIKDFNPTDTTLYFGIDWTESHRTKGIEKGCSKYNCKFPLVEDLSFNKADMFKLMESKGIDVPFLYAKGFPHNNCGGFCVRMGQGGFAYLMDNYNEMFQFHKKMESETRDIIGKNVAVLGKTVNGKRYPMSLSNFEKIYFAQKEGKKLSKEGTLDLLDFGGCWCFAMYNEDGTDDTDSDDK